MDETVFVTGASSGFGRVITERFLAAGARVVAASRRGFGGGHDPARLHDIELDVRDAAGVAAAVEPRCLMRSPPPSWSTTPGWRWG